MLALARGYPVVEPLYLPQLLCNVATFMFLQVAVLVDLRLKGQPCSEHLLALGVVDHLLDAAGDLMVPSLLERSLPLRPLGEAWASRSVVDASGR